MTTMPHAAHAMSHTARSTRAMESCMSRSEAGAVTDTSCRSHSAAVSTADVASASPVSGVALSVNGLRVLRMRHCLA